ncbi:MAG: hypothetical protein JGK21_28145 [Microcoleus sp. PH2017_22_RUC_O_B]|uniref:hypothetical protein n=1 Tax=Microcoleus sp. PH2017_22_RUC_O_B TaxID=2798833 RepID=UPI001DD0FBC7|nr:hypothetical protein [Microcoleus sp. PH2017_22_RUC_O_B]MCC3544137.1 hypothetical protein [Microcoleus sp. PH2017_22_RUC_O_B]
MTPPHPTLEDSHSGDFAELSNPESRHQHLTGKSLYTIPDTGGYITGVKPFYELVDNGQLSGRSLYSSCGYTKEWNCRFVAASVDHLQIENAGDGWDRRCLRLLSKEREGLEDPYLRHKLSDVKADIVSWALAMPREERDPLLLKPSKNNRIRLAKIDAATYGDPVRSFVDLCLRPSESASPIQNHELHSWFIAYCKAHGYSDNGGMSKFISHLKTVIPRHHLPRHRQDGELVAASWTRMALLPNVMVDVSEVAPASKGYQGTPNHQYSEPDWRCAKFRCLEGGLLAFEEFWSERSLLGGLTLDSAPIASNGLGGLTVHSAASAKDTTQNQGLNGYTPNDPGTAGGETVHSAPSAKNTQNQAVEGGDLFYRGDRGTAPQKNEGVGVVPAQQATPPQKREELFERTPTDPESEGQIHTGQGGGVSGDGRGIPTDRDLRDRFGADNNQTVTELVEFVRQAIAAGDAELAKYIQSILKEVCSSGGADRKTVWNLLTAEEQTAFTALLEPQPEPEPEPLLDPSDAQQIREIALIWWDELPEQSLLTQLAEHIRKYGKSAIVGWLAAEPDAGVRERIAELLERLSRARNFQAETEPDEKNEISKLPEL